MSEGTGPAADFAGMMNQAAESAYADAEQAPYGYTKDPDTGGMRPKKSPGRPRKSPSLEELKAPGDPMTPGAGGEESSGGAAPPETPEDRPPDESARRGRKAKTAVSREPVPAYRAGVIATGVNRLYRKAGKIVRAMDPDIGEAIIQAARNTAGEGEPDDSVGAAWDELARTNPRIRRFLMKAIAGGAWAQLLMAHAPIAMAIVLKPAILKRIPFRGLVESLAEPDEDTPQGDGGLPGGMTAADAEQMAAVAEQQMQRMGLAIPPEVRERMAAMAAAMANGAGPPFHEPAARAQPRNRTRAERRKAG